MANFVDSTYLESVLGTAVLQGLLTNQGTYNSGTATTNLNYLIADANAKVLAACWAAGIRSPGGRDILRAIAAGLVVVALYSRQGQTAPADFVNAAALAEKIGTGELPIPEETPDLIDGHGGVVFSDYTPNFKRNMRF